MYDLQLLSRNGSRFDNPPISCEYLASDLPQTDGIPSIGYFADAFHPSANYFGDLIKKETGKSALQHMQPKLPDVAKEKIFQYNKSVSEIAYELGFKYPNFFADVFK